MSINSSLNSCIKGGNTRIEIVNKMNDITNRTNISERNLGSFNKYCIWLHKLQITFDITKEQIIKSRKSLKVHIIKKLIIVTANLK